MGGVIGMARAWISPVIPVVANALLAALWGLSVFAGWGLEAFCSTGEASGACRDRMGGAMALSGIVAALAVCCVVGAWAVPGVRRDRRRFSTQLAVAVATWVVAEGVLFVGGVVGQ